MSSVCCALEFLKKIVKKKFLSFFLSFFWGREVARKGICNKKLTYPLCLPFFLLMPPCSEVPHLPRYSRRPLTPPTMLESRHAQLFTELPQKLHLKGQSMSVWPSVKLHTIHVFIRVAAIALHAQKRGLGRLSLLKRVRVFKMWNIFFVESLRKFRNALGVTGPGIRNDRLVCILHNPWKA